MDLPDENNEQIAKRQAIQSIIRDSSLAAEERQRRIQVLMNNTTMEAAENSNTTFVPTIDSDSARIAPSTNAPDVSAVPETSSQNMLQAITTDPPFQQNFLARDAPPEQDPETAAYAGLNYSGTVAMDGIAAYVAPGHVEEEEAIQALDVVTETQLKEEDSRKRRRYLLCGLGTLTILLIVVIVPVVITQKNKSKTVEIVNITDTPTDTPSESPTSSIFVELLSNIEQEYGQENESLFVAAMSDENSSQYKAAVWAADHMPSDVSGSDTRMISRYALASLYFSTNGDDWEVCGRGSTNCPPPNKWLDAENECDWYAVECEDPSSGDYSVVRIEFPPNKGKPRNIGGTLPIDVSFLPRLNFFVLTRESVAGSFPDWSKLTGLENILVNFNQLTGSFPEFLVEQNSLLTTLHLEGNSFHGPLPSFPESTSLTDLRLNGNAFTGTIVSEISNLKSLATLFLDNNEFVGDVPDDLYSLTNLSRLQLSNNTGLTGPISTSVGKMTNLISFKASNTSMGGSIEDSLFSLTKLQHLDLYMGSFNGGLSASFANLTELSSLKLYNNSFSGTIPAGLAQATYLNSLELHDNDLTGSVSEALCSRRGDGWSDLKVLTVDLDEVSCKCCTNQV